MTYEIRIINIAPADLPRIKKAVKALGLIQCGKRKDFGGIGKKEVFEFRAK